MKTLMVILALVAAIVATAVWRFSADAAAGAPVAPAVSSPPLTTQAAMPPMATGPVEVPANAPPGDVTRLIEEANSVDVDERLAAIAALAQAPRDQALPVLQRIVTQGEAQVDKPAALNSLRELALGQGDKDGKVRAAIREVLYHDDGQNPQLLVDAQEALDVVEELEMK